MKRPEADGWWFFLTTEQTSTLTTVLHFIADDLNRGSASDMARRIASNRVKDILNMMNDVTG